MSSTDAESKPTEQTKSGRGGLRRKQDYLLRQSEALRLRVEGKKDGEIAQILGYSDASAARSSWQAALGRIDSPHAGQLREILSMRYEEIYANLLPTLRNPPHTWDTEQMSARELEVRSMHFFRANDVALKAFNQYAKLHGAEAPVKVEVEDVTPDRESFLEKLNAYVEGYDYAKSEKSQVTAE